MYFTLVSVKLIRKMTTVFIKTLSPILIMSKLFGFMNIAYTLESGILRRNTSSAYYSRLEVTRMFLLLMITLVSCQAQSNYLRTSFVAQFWILVAVTRISEDSIVKYEIIIFRNVFCKTSIKSIS